MSDLQTSFYFSLSITGNDSSSDAAFQEASGLIAQMDTEDVVSGGENRFKYRLPSNVTYQNLVLKRGVAKEASPLIEWCQQIFNSRLAKPIVTKNVMLHLLNKAGKPGMSWGFVKAYPVKWVMGDLKSQESSVLIETIELAYRYCEVTDPRSKAN